MMPLSEIFFLAIVLYLLYRFVFNFLLPVVRTTRQVRQQFRNMQEGMGGEQQSFNSGERVQSQQKQQRPSGGKPPVGDYIDFEEIK
ncbi:MAG TPA: hypothetical protein VL727_09960 [Puia sp.]|jgi:hypothetical protein|nr:hypothetical protein [Puia sp.]